MFSRMELSDLLLLVHTIGCVACTPAAADAPSGVNWPPNQQWPMPAPTDSDSVLSRIQAAVRQLDDWPNALYEMLKSVNLRFRPKPGSTGRKSVLVSRMGRILQHPPYELSGRPLQPIAEEVRRFVEQSVGQTCAQPISPAWTQRQLESDLSLIHQRSQKSWVSQVVMCG
jgi:hypothetical protein